MKSYVGAQLFVHAKLFLKNLRLLCVIIGLYMRIFLYVPLLLLAVINTVRPASYELTSHVGNGPVVIKNSVADMNSDFSPLCDRLSICPDVKKCDRTHQGLFNEVMNCIDQGCIEDEGGLKTYCVKVECSDIIYGFDKNSKALNTFWIDEKHIVPLEKLETAIAHTIPHCVYAQEPTIILTYPWQNFSVGTRFRHMPEHDTDGAYAIIRADYQAGAVVRDWIPHENGIREVKEDAQAMRELFVKNINNLVDRVAAGETHNNVAGRAASSMGQLDLSGERRVIPYVWGGSSFVHSYAGPDFYNEDGAWHRIGKNDPYTGYDCSGFVRRMARGAGIDFPWKTTVAIERAKRALNDTDRLQHGDLIWMPGHVIIVSNIERNELIEARGYGHGYGCVHRITLDECFVGISTYEDLLKRYYDHETIERKNKEGVCLEAPKVFKLLKLID